MRYCIKLSYCGASFCGWQSQPDAPSVQEILEKALSVLLGGTVQVTGAGRTDSKVNACGYIAHFDGREGLEPMQFRYKLNAILPDSVIVHSIKPVADDFHARFDATKREYSYFLHRTKDPFIGNFSYFCGYRMDFEAMDKAAAMLIGRHDFSCFEKVGADNKTSICTVFEAGWHPYVPTHLALMPSFSENEQSDADSSGGSAYWYFRISADRFLRNMVRAVVGTLIEVGRGKRSLEDFAALVLPAEPSGADADTHPSGTPSPERKTGPRRCLAGESVPGHALFLDKVEY